jgi:LEA14-like dessication related protein
MGSEVLTGTQKSFINFFFTTTTIAICWFPMIQSTSHDIKSLKANFGRLNVAVQFLIMVVRLDAKNFPIKNCLISDAVLMGT